MEMALSNSPQSDMDVALCELTARCNTVACPPGLHNHPRRCTSGMCMCRSCLTCVVQDTRSPLVHLHLLASKYTRWSPKKHGIWMMMYMLLSRTLQKSDTLQDLTVLALVVMWVGENTRYVSIGVVCHL